MNRYKWSIILLVTFLFASLSFSPTLYGQEYDREFSKDYEKKFKCEKCYNLCDIENLFCPKCGNRLLSSMIVEIETGVETDPANDRFFMLQTGEIINKKTGYLEINAIFPGPKAIYRGQWYRQSDGFTYSSNDNVCIGFSYAFTDWFQYGLGFSLTPFAEFINADVKISPRIFNDDVVSLAIGYNINIISKYLIDSYESETPHMIYGAASVKAGNVKIGGMISRVHNPIILDEDKLSGGLGITFKFSNKVQGITEIVNSEAFVSDAEYVHSFGLRFVNSGFSADLAFFRYMGEDFSNSFPGSPIINLSMFF